MGPQRRWLPALLLLALLPASAARAQSALATAQTVNGAVSVTRRATMAVTPLASRASLFAGDLVTTGANGSATVLFSDSSQIDLKANTSIRIVAPAPVGKGERSLYEAVVGEVVNRIRPGRAVKTPSAIAGTRGTTFHLAVDAEGVTTLTVLEGEVQFFNARGGVLVGESQQSVARPDAAPTAPITIPNAGLLIEWSLELERVVIPREQFFISPDRSGVGSEMQRRGERARLQPTDPETRRAYGDALFDGGRLVEALREFQEADRLAPGQPASLTRLGDTLLALNRLEEAESSYRAALAVPGLKSRSAGTKPTFVGSAAAESVPADFVTADRDFNSGEAAAWVGLAWISLTRNRPADAQQSAQQALAVGQADRRVERAESGGRKAESGRPDFVGFRLSPSALRLLAPADSLPHTIEARIALGLSLLRQPGQRDAAIPVFQAALTGEPVTYRYQVHAWLALAYLAREDAGAALKEGQEATRAAPRSALAHGNLALVYFHSGKPREAEREARLATRLDPDSVAARVVLGQALLAAGDVDGAARAGAQAVALDRGLPEAHYLLGIADAQRRDYRHAARELRESLRLAPEYTTAAGALARVYTRMGRKNEGVTLLTELLSRHPQSHAVLAALGGIDYEQGHYPEAAERYRGAIRVKPNSALYHAELARALLDANRLGEAIRAGEQAVRLAPDVGQYHAVLGLAYDFSRLSVQAEREFREALAVDPQNALAQLELGLKSTEFDPQQHRTLTARSGQSLDELLRQGLQAVGSGPAVSSITQAFLYDPAISEQVLRGGIGGQATLSGGNHSALNPSVTHRTVGVDGRLHSLGLLDRFRDDGDRANDDLTAFDFTQNLTFVSDARTSLFGRFSYRRTRQGLPDRASTPDLNDRENAHQYLPQLALRRRIGSGRHLWLGLSRPTGRVEVLNPDRDQSFFIPTPDGNGVTLGAVRRELEFHSLVPEARLDLGLNRSPDRPAILTVGATETRIEPSLTAQLFFPSDPPVITPLGTRLDGRLRVAYVQWTQRISSPLSLVAQLRWQRLVTTTTVDVLGGDAITSRDSRSHWLPNLVANYRTDSRTLLRLFFNRQAQEQDLAPIAFLPVGTLLSTEPLVMPRGTPNRTQTAEIDAERYLSSQAFVKLFLFRTTADGVNLGNSPSKQRLERTGVGLRYEQRLSRDLFGQIGCLFNRTTNSTPFAPFNGGTAPYQPPRLAGLALNYVSPSGTKIGLQLNYTGRYFQDTGDVSARMRPVFPAHTYVDLTLAHEPSLRYEFFLTITNLFNRPAIEFNDFPTRQRRVVIGATMRF